MSTSSAPCPATSAPPTETKIIPAPPPYKVASFTVSFDARGGSTYYDYRLSLPPRFSSGEEYPRDVAMNVLHYTVKDATPSSSTSAGDHNVISQYDQLLSDADIENTPLEWNILWPLSEACIYTNSFVPLDTTPMTTTRRYMDGDQGTELHSAVIVEPQDVSTSEIPMPSGDSRWNPKCRDVYILFDPKDAEHFRYRNKATDTDLSISLGDFASRIANVLSSLAVPTAMYWMRPTKLHLVGTGRLDPTAFGLTKPQSTDAAGVAKEIADELRIAIFANDAERWTDPEEVASRLAFMTLEDMKKANLMPSQQRYVA